MKKILVAAGLCLAFLLPGSVHAVVNAPVNIAYPLAGSANDNYVPFSFSVTCPGGPQTVKWAFDGVGFGSSTYYDNFSAQFHHKLTTGWHTFEVYTNCGQDRVQFYVN